jgi:aryl-alcohol dehydrogenase-like predicted oxidoreductase
LGFGCWQIAGQYATDGKPLGWGPITREQATRLVHQALETGVQFFDTAAGYGGGHGEEVLGQAIRSSPYRDKAVICTKVPVLPDELQAMALGPSFRNRIEASLARLHVDRIDVFLLHGPPDELDWRSFDTSMLDSLVREGTIGTYGISARSLAGVLNALNDGFGTCVEWVFNLLERRPAVQLFPQTIAKGVNFIARSPLSKGLLSEKYRTVDPAFPPDEFRATLPPDWVRWSVETMRRFPDPDGDIAQAAVRYCLSHEGMSVVIPGIRTGEQLERMLAAYRRGGFTPAQVASLVHATPSHYPGWS